MRKALFFGSNGNAQFIPLQYARSDARRVAKAFHEHGGFDVEVLDASSASALRDRLYNFLSETAEAEAVAIYFAGHGECRKGELFLVLDNTNPSNFLGTALRCSDITAGLKFSNAVNKLLILDCCSAGTGARGIRGLSVSIEEAVPDSESFTIFAASEALEPTREHKRWSGSFLSDLLVDALSKERRLTLSDLNNIARVKAKQHHAKHPDERLSTPFMFGSQSGSFSLTYREQSAFILRFDDQLEHNLPHVIEQVRKLKFAPIAIRHTVQWQVEWPEAYDLRFEILSRFKNTGSFPTLETVDPKPLKKMVDDVIKKRAGVEDFIVRALRQCISIIFEDESESDDWQFMLDIALRSAVFLMGRTLYAVRFDGEGSELWHQPFFHTEIDWGSDIILGLAPVWTALQTDESVLFWTDADYYQDRDSFERQRVYLPINETRLMNRRLIFGTLGPQLLWANIKDIWKIAYDAREADETGDVRNLRVRDESFIEIEHFRSPDPNQHRLRQVERSIVKYFEQKGFANVTIVHKLTRGSLDTSKVMSQLRDRNVKILQQ